MSQRVGRSDGGVGRPGEAVGFGDVVDVHQHGHRQAVPGQVLRDDRDHTIKAVTEDGRTKTMRITIPAGGDVRKKVVW